MGEAVQVWDVPLSVSEDLIAEYSQCLSEDEQKRAARFRFEADRRKFVVARGVLRHLLSERLGCRAIALTFDYGKYGKPKTTVLSAKGRDFHFNLSHSGEIALCALGGDRTVGIDIEKVRPIQRLESMMERCLVETEKAKVTSQPIDQQTHDFLQYWTCKEAYLKAIGVGLSQSMTTVEVDPSLSRLIKVPRDRKEDGQEDWQLHTLDLPETYVGALVVAGKSAVEIAHWQHSSFSER
jgi:4'-phosphopantetheinyl transferase